MNAVSPAKTVAEPPAESIGQVLRELAGDQPGTGQHAGEPAQLAEPARPFAGHFRAEAHLAAAFDLDPEFQPKLKGSVGEGPNQTNYSDQSSVKILSKFNAFC